MVNLPPTPCCFLVSFYPGGRQIFIATGWLIDLLLRSSVPFLLLFVNRVVFYFFSFFLPFCVAAVVVSFDVVVGSSFLPISSFRPMLLSWRVPTSSTRIAKEVYRNRLHRPPIDSGNSNFNRLESNNAELGSQRFVRVSRAFGPDMDSLWNLRDIEGL